MSMSIKKRLALGAGAVATVGAVATLVAGVTFGLFSATNTQASPSTFATGTVAIGSPVNTNCTVTKMVPGDESAHYTASETGEATESDATTATCVFQVHYTGSVPAYIGLSTSLDTSAGTLGGALQWQIVSDTTATSTSTEPTQPGSYTSGGVINDSSVSPLYVAKDVGGVSGDKFYTFYVDYQLPIGTTDQTLTAASLSLTVQAVQVGNNGDASTCVQGSACAASSTGVLAWS